MCKLSFLLNSTATGGVDGRCDILFYCCRMDKEAQPPTGSYYLKGGESRVLTSPPPTPSFHFVDVSGGWGSAAHWVYSHMGWRDWSTVISTSHHPHQSHWCHMGPHQHWRGTRVGQNQGANYLCFTLCPSVSLLLCGWGSRGSASHRVGERRTLMSPNLHCFI